MTLENFKELVKDKLIVSKLPGLPWRLQFPLIATLDVDGYYTPDSAENPFPGTSIGFGKGYAHGLSDSDDARIALTEDFLQLYFNEAAMKELKKLMRDMKWAKPFGNPLFNLWGATYESYSNWQVVAGSEGKLHLTTSPLTEVFYQKLTPYFTPAQIGEMKAQQIEDIAFDKQGNSVWSKQGVMDGVPGPFEGHPTRYNYTGSKVIVGGTGRYVEAGGQYHFSGYSDNIEQPLEGQPSSITRIGIWGTIEYWWPSVRLQELAEITEKDLREFVHPMNVQEDVLRQVVNEKMVVEEGIMS